MHERAHHAASSTRALAAVLVVAVTLLAGATAARAQAPPPTQPTNAAHAAAVIPPRVFPIRLVPMALRTPRVQRVVTRINSYWQRVKTYAKEHPDEILDRFEDLSDAIDLALDAWDQDDPSTCTPYIEPLCARVGVRHNSGWPAYGIVLAGRYAGRAVWLTCQGYSNGQLAYYTPTLRTAFYTRYVWTYWYPALVPNMASCR